jgi:hypothetical protein
MEKKRFREGHFAKVLFNGLVRWGGHLIRAGGSTTSFLLFSPVQQTTLPSSLGAVAAAAEAG